MAITRSCDICGSSLGNVQRYSMQHKQRATDNDVKASLSMGGLDLCDQCWASTAEPRMRQYIANILECDICRSTEDVLRLTLKQSKREDGKVRDRGKGSLVLCLNCWTDIGLPKMRAKPDKQTDPVRVFALNARRLA